jgi:hypothetical protein
MTEPTAAEVEALAVVYIAAACEWLNSPADADRSLRHAADDAYAPYIVAYRARKENTE